MGVSREKGDYVADGRKRRGMKEAIQDLECALEKLSYVDAGIVYTVCEKPFRDAKGLIRVAVAHLKKVAAIAELPHPYWETPEQYEKRTGEKWPNGWAVYALYENNNNGNRWVFCESYYFASSELCEGNRLVAIICATEAGPPPVDWRPGVKQ
jgi:hypothetical protein